MEERCPICQEIRTGQQRECPLCGHSYEERNQSLMPVYLFGLVFTFSLLYVFARKNSMHLRFIKVLAVVVAVLFFFNFLEERRHRQKPPP